MMTNVHKFVRCIIWFCRNVPLINVMMHCDGGQGSFLWFVTNIQPICRILRYADGEKNFQWFFQNTNVIARVMKSLGENSD